MLGLGLYRKLISHVALGYCASHLFHQASLSSRVNENRKLQGPLLLLLLFCYMSQSDDERDICVCDWTTDGKAAPP